METGLTSEASPSCPCLLMRSRVKDSTTGPPAGGQWFKHRSQPVGDVLEVNHSGWIQ